MPRIFQNEAEFTKDMIYPQESCHSHKTVVVQDESMGGGFIKMIGAMELVHTQLLWMMPNNSLLISKDFFNKYMLRKLGLTRQKTVVKDALLF